MMNFNIRLSIRTALLIIFSFAISCHASTPLLGQDETAEGIMAKAKKKQAKMMETQYLTMQLTQLSYNTDLQKELEIVGDQLDAVKELVKSYQKQQMDFHSENRQLMQEASELMKEGKHQEAREVSEEYQEKRQALSDEFMDRVNETLLPHQTQRLLEISKQRRIKSMNPFKDEFGIPVALADEIGLSVEEKAKLMETTEQARKKYYEEVDALKKETNQEIMKSLSVEHQEKIREILGDAYDSELSRRRNSEEMRAKTRKATEKLRMTQEKLRKMTEPKEDGS